jgi:hypothetical protein
MLKVSLTENSLGRSAYSMDMHMFEPYIWPNLLLALLISVGSSRND